MTSSISLGGIPSLLTIPQTPGGSLIPQTPSMGMAPQTPSMIPQTPGGSLIPQTPGGSMIPQTPSMAPQTPSMVPQTPSMVPQTPSMVPQTPGGSIIPQTPAVGSGTTEHRSTSGIVPTLQNIVSTVNLCTRLDLKRIALQARNAEYNPKRFAAVIMRIREPKTTALIFASGKMVCTGAKSESESRLAARKYARIIQKLGFQAKFMDFKIQNIVGSCDVQFPIRLEGLAYAHENYSSYEPEIFPGLIYRMVQPKIVLLIFVSGKIVLTGAKVRSDIYEAFENIYPVLTEFRKSDRQ